MLNTPKMKQIYEQIQQQLFYMIPEKWDRVYLYASVYEQINHLQTGEMFFYYFPKGLLKKNPVNVYEVPIKFNVDETAYFQLADRLYAKIKQLREELIEKEQKPWTNLTISIEQNIFRVEYSYYDLKSTVFTNYDRHIIWRCKYLKTPLESLNKEERNKVMQYINFAKEEDIERQTYVQPVTIKTGKTVIEYQSGLEQETTEETARKRITVEYHTSKTKYIKVEKESPQKVLERQLMVARNKAKQIEEKLEQNKVITKPRKK